MYHGISNNKNLISNHNCVNIMQKTRIFYIITLIIAFFIILGNVLYCEPIASATDSSVSNNEIELKLETEIEKIVNEADFSEIESMLGELSSSYGELLNSISLKDFLLKVISGADNVSYLDFFNLLKIEVIDIVRSIMSPLLLIFCIILLCNIFSLFKADRTKNSVADVIYYIALSLIIIILSLLVKNVIDKCSESVRNITKQVNLIFPIILTLMTAIGATSSVHIYSPVLSFFSTTIINIFENVLFPIFTFIILTVIVSKFTKNNRLQKMQGFFSSGFKWVLGGMSTIFMTFLSFQGITASVKDGLSLKAAKFAIKNYIPFLGGYISDGYEIVKAGSVLVKNALGVSSIFLLMITIIQPILYLCVLSLGLKLISASCEIIDSMNISSLLYDISTALKYLVSIVIGVACMYFFILFLCISTGNTISWWGIIMFSFKTWMITVAGGSLLISLFEMILPPGRMNDFSKCILNLIYVYIIIFPIIAEISKML